ncbi:MAG TPA: FAD-dependent monooxygenase [Candidatus Acidoferrales bacterium]|jgi:2-polyprenyl-6-methoxyphenol hydroxylase-like FAD-dependent oxidoreductase|nr:FAD-dependent monooxygenase [Candidatus Acidoferrales bacterium]
MPEIEVPVLIVGGSLVGMSAALLLGHHGIPTLVVEHHRGTAIHPRAAMITQRTMEIFRTVGVEQIVLKKSDEQFVQDGAIMAVETLAGKEVAWFIANLNEGVRDVSPSSRIFITQNLLEPLLKSRAEELGAQLRFNTEMTSFEEHATGVTAEIRDRDSGKTSTVRARYMIAADGSHSRIRERLGIRMLGHGVFSKSITIYFRGNVAPLLRGRNLSVMYVVNPTLSGFFRIEKPFTSGFLAVHWLGDSRNPVTDVSKGLTNESALEMLYAALGTRDVPIAIENVMHWDAAADVAERFQHGRILLTGDSAHVMPPSGGFGGNTGVQDAHNLAWKLALVVKGAAGPELLATYDPERRPAAVFTVEQAYSRYVARSAPYLRSDDMQAIQNDLNIELGYCYHSSAVIPDGAGDSVPHENPRESKGKPGTRAPHVALERNGEKISTLDLFGKHLVLLAGPEGAVWREIGRGAARQLGLSLDIHEIGTDRLTDPSGAFSSAYGIAPAGAVLVRPDGFIAWRSKDAKGASTENLGRTLSSLLSIAPA